MGRPPKLSISQWFRHNEERPWVRDARCGGRHDLPWDANHVPAQAQIEQMAAVCAQCPVIASCAAYALSTAGGFYAGVWLPWRTSNETDAVKLRRLRGRRELKRIEQWAEAVSQ